MSGSKVLIILIHFIIQHCRLTIEILLSFFFMSFFSKRWETIWFLFMGVIINYCLRVNVSIAASKMKDELGWSEAQKGYFLSSFFWGYALGQIPATLLAGQIGAKHTFLFAIFMSSFLSLLTPSAAKMSFSLALLVRALVGLASSSCFPSCYHFFPKWIPLSEKTIMVSTVGSGIYFGEIIGFSLSGFLVDTDSSLSIEGLHVGGWPSAFYFFGVVGMLWSPFFYWTVYASPEDHPGISRDELNLIKGEDTSHEVKKSSLLESVHGYDIDHIVYSHRDEVGHAGREASRSHSNTSKQSRTNSMSLAINDFSVPNLDGEIIVSKNSHGNSEPLLVANEANDSLTSEKPFNKYDFHEIPWRAMLTHPAAIALFVSNWSFGWIGFMLLSEIPSFLVDILGYDLEESGLLSIAPYGANFMSVVMFAQLFDFLQVERGWETKRVRITATIISYIGASVCLVICGFIKIPGVAFTFMVFSLFFFGASQSGIACAYLDTSPNYSSILNTIGNTFGAVAGLCGPLVVSLFTSVLNGAWGWRCVFFLTLVQSIISVVVFSMYYVSTPVNILNTPTSRYNRI